MTESDRDKTLEVMARAMFENFRIEEDGPAGVSWDAHGCHVPAHDAYLDAARAALTAYESHLQASGRAVVAGWQPIESAPKDGPAFLVWLSDEGFATLAYWRQWQADGESGADWYLPAMDVYADEHVATLWMPLPTASPYGKPVVQDEQARSAAPHSAPSSHGNEGDD